MTKPLMLDYFAMIEDDLVAEIESMIELLAMDQETRMFAVQPLTSVARLAAHAAASVLVAFEHGYQMSDEVSGE